MGALCVYGGAWQGGGGVEVAGALQVISDLLLQSVTQPDTSGDSFMALFPLPPLNNSDASFVRHDVGR